CYLADVLAGDVGWSRRQTSGGGGRREYATVLPIFRHGYFSSARDRQAFRNLRTNRVVLVSRNSDCRQDADNRYDDHQFDKRKALLNLLHFLKPHVQVSVLL